MYATPGTVSSKGEKTSLYDSQLVATFHSVSIGLSLLRHCLLLDADHYINAIEARAQDVASDPLLIVLRGLPGSGKSTLGKAIKAACRDGDVVSENRNVLPKGHEVSSLFTFADRRVCRRLLPGPLG